MISLHVLATKFRTKVSVPIGTPIPSGKPRIERLDLRATIESSKNLGKQR
jgi:hypothetical protein